MCKASEIHKVMTVGCIAIVIVAGVEDGTKTDSYQKVLFVKREQTVTTKFVGPNPGSEIFPD